jgi:plasmid maintenance system antidote protein VapI
MSIAQELTRENASELLVNFIADKNVKQAEIAKKSGLTENTISLIVNGSKPQIVTVIKLKKYFASIGQ